jgi:hypothetical protein
MAATDKRTREYKERMATELTGKQADTPDEAATGTERAAIQPLSGPRPLPTAYTPPTENDESHGAKAYPGCHISWWPDNTYGRGQANKRDLTLFKASDGYCVNAKDFEQDSEGHLKHGGDLAYVEAIEHYQSRCQAKVKEITARLPKAKNSSARDEEGALVEQESVTTGSETVRVERDFGKSGFANPDVDANLNEITEE